MSAGVPNAPVVGPSGSTYSTEIADQICEHLVDGLTLRAISQMQGMPSRGTIFRWLQAFPEFREKYDIARQLQAEVMADDMVGIADDGTNDFMEDKTAKGEVRVVTDHENINRSRLRVDARRYLMSKFHPRRYGERVDMNLGGSVGAQLIIRGRDDPDPKG